MTTHDHSVKKQVDTTPSQFTQEQPTRDDVLDLDSLFAVQRVIQKPNTATLTPKTILQLQRMIGNSGTKRLLATSGVSLTTQAIQRSEGPKNALAEKQYVTVNSGEQIKWTDLVGGCIAFAFKYSGGGGMGYHLVMNDSEDVQWNELVSKVDKGKIVSIHMFSDQLNNAEGWRVPMDYEDYMMEGAKKAGRIRSTVNLMESGINPDQNGDYIEGQDTYWSHTWAAIQEWMKGMFGVTPTYEEKMKGVTYTF
jgi:hypothetical protein